MRCLALLLVVKTVLGSLIGVDIGNAFMKISIAMPGYPFEMVLDMQSKRKTPTAISFSEPQREYGSDALMRESRNPHLVFSYLNDLVSSDAGLAEDFHGYTFVHDDERGITKVQVREGLDLAGEEYLAMYLVLAKKLAASTIRHRVPNPDSIPLTFSDLELVVAVPVNYSMRRRQAVVDAAAVAGMNLKALISQPAAAALYHAVDRDSSSALKLFYDLGAKHIQACVVEYGPGANGALNAVSILGCGQSTGTQGGKLVDTVLANYLLDEFQKQNNVKVNEESMSRVMSRLTKEALGKKQILSANKQTTVFLENVFDGKNFRVDLDRPTVDGILEKQGVLEALRTPVNLALEAAGKQLEQIEEIEVIGGAWRVPRILQELEAISKEVGEGSLGQHCNGDEASVMGALLYGANYSQVFRVKKLLYRDASYFNYTMTATKDGKQTKTKQLIPRGGILSNIVKRMRLEADFDDLVIEIKENDRLMNTYVADLRGVKQQAKDVQQKALKSREEHLELYKEQNPKARIGETKSPQVFIYAKTGLMGIPEIQKIVVQWETETFKLTERKVRKPVSTEAPTEVPSETKTEETTEETMTEETTDVSSHMESDFSTTTTTTTTGAPEYKIVKKVNVTRRTREVEAPFSVHYVQPLPLGSEGIAKAKATLKRLDEEDSAIFDIQKNRNDYESYLYEVRDRLQSESVLAILAPEEQESIARLVSAASDWLAETSSLNPSEFTSRRAALQEQVDQVLSKATEFEERPHLFSEITRKTKKLHAKVTIYGENNPFCDKALFKKTLTNVEEFQSWFQTIWDEQKLRKATDEPLFTVQEVRNKFVQLKSSLKQLLQSDPHAERPETASEDAAEKSDDLKNEL
ncbi:MAG: hypothetical protein KVP17_004879 [Porospora cf. gigantea B]|uniref:uncharacterized protein n=1 Tax=Porospora cf. gigantea B TaxID=2853592 RepID=UPI003571AF52|nr:MAG: hypothetical protein KVP17_004879 [Porospora cf. gigantea B]